MKYDFKNVEKFFQDQWNFVINSGDGKKKCYVLEMFPYPSGNIHVGHLRNYTIGDVIARYKRACGFSVLHPIGWDAFGLPAENAARDNNVHPRKWTLSNIKNMSLQLKSLGLSYNWDRELATCDPEYYKHEQKLFLDFLKHGIAYKKESLVNWDPVDQTVLANEQVIDGRGWRSGAAVEKRKLSQWFLKITDFADDLLKCLKDLKGWPEKVKTMQERWIGKSEGASIEFEIINANEKLEIFTTCQHTLFGASFCAIAPDHLLIHNVTNEEIRRCIDEMKTSNKIGDKLGVYIGINVKHPFLDKELPIYATNFVLMEYGKGAIFGCPAHDQRDFEFAQKYDLPIISVVHADNADIAKEAYTGNGIMYNSEFLDGLTVEQAKETMLSKLEESGIGIRAINYQLRDWGVSRQRYWGCPIPIIYCQACGIVPIPEADLPVLLPQNVEFAIGGNPLDHHPEWKNVICPNCGIQAKRETDTFDTFFESSWYFAAFCSENKSIDNNACCYLMPVDYYIGGIEHAVLHLLYSRFFCRALVKCGYFNIKEPFSNLITQGMVCHATYKDENGRWLFPEEAQGLMENNKNVLVGKIEKMSKSKKNTIDLSYIIDKYGADTARLFVLSDTPPEKDMLWSVDGIEGCARYINKLYSMVMQLRPISINYNCGDDVIVDKAIEEHRRNIHKLLYSLTSELESCRLNTVVAKFREMTNIISEIDVQTGKHVVDEGIGILIRVIEPFIPHIAEHLWKEIGGTGMLYLRPWPKANQTLIIDQTVTIAIQVNGKLRSTISVAKNLAPEELKKAALDNIGNRIEKNKIRSIYAVPNKIVNIVL